jgi:Ca2+-binding RTX toxin-like protein
MAALGTRQLVLTIGGTDYTTQVSKVVITSEAADSDFMTFADAASGGARLYKLAFIAVQDAATGTLWDKVFTVAGTTVAYLLKPYGNAAASVGQPHYSGNAVITEPDGDFIGGEADSSTTARFTFECEWELTAKPTKVTS